jgi:glycosyltransferase involved in cell wall biosynthesis
MEQLYVNHLVAAMGGAKHLWGKENVIYRLMHAQRARGEIVPQLIVFTPCMLSDVAAADGFAVRILEERHHRLPLRALSELRSIMRENRAILHTHDYKANVVGRIARVSGIPMASLVSSCYGWINETKALEMYQAVDRWTSGFSYVATAPDEAMLRRFPAFVRTQYVPNAIPDRAVPTAEERARARAALGFDRDSFVLGTLSRLSPEKGIYELLEAARQSPSGHVLWAVAGAGPLQAEVTAAQSDVLRYVGYVDSADDFFAGIDVFVQPSRTEGLSLSLLEAMRSRLPIIATEVGATALAVRDGREGLLVPPRDPARLIEAALRLERDRDFAEALATQARTRFEEMWQIDVQYRAFRDVYLRSLAHSRPSVSTVG